MLQARLQRTAYCVLSFLIWAGLSVFARPDRLRATAGGAAGADRPGCTTRTSSGGNRQRFLTRSTSGPGERRAAVHGDDVRVRSIAARGTAQVRACRFIAALRLGIAVLPQQVLAADPRAGEPGLSRSARRHRKERLRWPPLWTTSRHEVSDRPRSLLSAHRRCCSGGGACMGRSHAEQCSSTWWLCQPELAPEFFSDLSPSHAAGWLGVLL